MTTISAKMVSDSVSPAGIRLTTMQLRYPKFIHGELMTHRAFSRNASSSRAIPVERLIQNVLDDTAGPVSWGKNQRGMQADGEHRELVPLDGWFNANGPVTRKVTREEAWSMARDDAIRMARAFSAAGYHKQIVNRLIEPFCHIDVVVTATDWNNFFALRCHPDAQPEMRVLAEKMRDARDQSAPKRLECDPSSPFCWHLPYVDVGEEMKNWPQVPLQECRNNLIKLSVARCARVSYSQHDGTRPDASVDLKLYERLVGSAPLHASPCEHQATPDELVNKYEPGYASEPGGGHHWKNPDLHGNLRGFIQYRKTIPGERVEE